MALKSFINRIPTLYMSHSNDRINDFKFDNTSPLHEYIQEMVKCCEPSAKLVKHISTKLLYIDENTLYYYMSDPSIANVSYSAVVIYDEPNRPILKNYKNRNFIAYTHSLIDNSIGKVKDAEKMKAIIQDYISDACTNMISDHIMTLISISENIMYMHIRNESNTIILFDNHTT